MTAAELRLLLWAWSSGCCWYCGAHQPERPSSRQIDHVFARGSYPWWDEPWNSLPACSYCNATKGAKPLEEFRIILGRAKAGWPHFTNIQLPWVLVHIPEPARFIFHGEAAGLFPHPLEEREGVRLYTGDVSEAATMLFPTARELSDPSEYFQMSFHAPFSDPSEKCRKTARFRE